MRRRGEILPLLDQEETTKPTLLEIRIIHSQSDLPAVVLLNSAHLQTPFRPSPSRLFRRRGSPNRRSCQIRQPRLARAEEGRRGFAVPIPRTAHGAFFRECILKAFSLLSWEEQPPAKGREQTPTASIFSPVPPSIGPRLGDRATIAHSVADYYNTQ